ncbi:hypothetical protein E2562_006355 [Oryza meyeriana var. granulata]|uniref:Uncharacterized protein n=1 Tax=Oryza meyeriana var. granulata TaxID=110450 RepID=A0A6G1EGB8_9ORYZ|nr:hypothetical protein E2562_006355 [Oryza meyeriana var. granulata]
MLELDQPHLDLPRSASRSSSTSSHLRTLLGQLHLDVPRSSSTNRIRTFGPRDVEDQFHIYKLKDEIRAAVAKIEKIYSRLQIDKDLLEPGFCFGLVHPVTNILINSAISRSQVRPAADRVGGGGGGEKAGVLIDNGRRRRRRVVKAPDVNELSLDGLIAFLTCLFPYLPDAEARIYLRAADADPFVASLLIINRRGMREFDFNSQTTEAAVEVALRCAAVAAKHPDPQGLVLGWKKISHVVEAFRSEPPRNMQVHVVLRAQKVLDANGASDPVLQLKGTWELARGRLMRASSKIYGTPKVLPPARGPMKRMLLATIHGFYLQAMGRLPTSELCSLYHRSMLFGGYCYGPLDPVSNIIVNTIWYEQNIPASKQFQISMISTQLLWRIAARSLYGLVSFLCTRYRGLTPDLAMQRLLVTGVNLEAADPNLKKRPDPSHIQHSVVEESTPSASVHEAYTAAATAALHDYPLAQTQFLSSPSSVSKLEFVSEVLHSQVCVPGTQDGVSESASESGGPLSPKNLSFLRMMLQYCPSSIRESHQQQDLACRKVKRRDYRHISRCSGRFWGQHARVTSMVRDALDKFNNTVEDRPFVLHIICGVNELVSGPVPSMGEKVGDYNPWTYSKYYHTHINFLAVCKARPYDPPTLFFAECGKDGADTCWCVPVIPQKPEAGQVRCIYCESEGNRILHPAVESFYGRDEFEKLFYGSDDSYTNDELIKHTEVDVDWVHVVEDDAIYVDCCADSDDDDEDDLIDIC